MSRPGREEDTKRAPQPAEPRPLCLVCYPQLPQHGADDPGPPAVSYLDNGFKSRQRKLTPRSKRKSPQSARLALLEEHKGGTDTSRERDGRWGGRRRMERRSRTRGPRCRFKKTTAQQPAPHLKSFLLASMNGNSTLPTKDAMPSLVEVIQTLEDAWPPTKTFSPDRKDGKDEHGRRSRTLNRRTAKVLHFSQPLMNRRFSVPEEVMRKYSVIKERTSEESEENKTMPEITSPSSKEEKEEVETCVQPGTSTSSMKQEPERNIKFKRSGREALKSEVFARRIDDDEVKVTRNVATVTKKPDLSYLGAGARGKSFYVLSESVSPQSTSTEPFKKTARRSDEDEYEDELLNIVQEGDSGSDSYDSDDLPDLSGAPRGLRESRTIKRAPLRRGSVVELPVEPTGRRVTQNQFYNQGKGIIHLKAVERGSQTADCICNTVTARADPSSSTASAKEESEECGTSESISSPAPCAKKEEDFSDNLSSESDYFQCTCAEISSSKETSSDRFHSGKSTLSQDVSDKTTSTQDSTVSINSVSTRGSTISANSNSSSPEVDPKTSAKETTTSPDHTPRTSRDPRTPRTPRTPRGRDRSFSRGHRKPDRRGGRDDHHHDTNCPKYGRRRSERDHGRRRKHEGETTEDKVSDGRTKHKEEERQTQHDQEGKSPSSGMSTRFMAEDLYNIPDRNMRPNPDQCRHHMADCVSHCDRVAAQMSISQYEPYYSTADSDKSTNGATNTNQKNGGHSQMTQTGSNIMKTLPEGHKQKQKHEHRERWRNIEVGATRNDTKLQHNTQTSITHSQHNTHTKDEQGEEARLDMKNKSTPKEEEIQPKDNQRQRKTSKEREHENDSRRRPPDTKADTVAADNSKKQQEHKQANTEQVKQQQEHSDQYKWSKLTQEEVYMIQQQRHRKFMDNQRRFSVPIAQVPDTGTLAGCVGNGSVYKEVPGVADGADLMVPRYSALPRSISMLVNTSADNSTHNSDSDNHSLADSLEEHPSTRMHRLYFDTKQEAKPVRGDATSISQEKAKQLKPKENKGRAFFVSITEKASQDAVLSSITKIPEPPDKIKAQIFERHQQICKKTQKEVSDSQTQTTGKKNLIRDKTQQNITKKRDKRAQKKKDKEGKIRAEKHVELLADDLSGAGVKQTNTDSVKQHGDVRAEQPLQEQIQSAELRVVKPSQTQLGKETTRQMLQHSGTARTNQVVEAAKADLNAKAKRSKEGLKQDKDQVKGRRKSREATSRYHSKIPVPVQEAARSTSSSPETVLPQSSHEKHHKKTTKKLLIRSKTKRNNNFEDQSMTKKEEESSMVVKQADTKPSLKIEQLGKVKMKSQEETKELTKANMKSQAETKEFGKSNVKSQAETKEFGKSNVKSQAETKEFGKSNVRIQGSIEMSSEDQPVRNIDNSHLTGGPNNAVNTPKPQAVIHPSQAPPPSSAPSMTDMNQRRTSFISSIESTATALQLQLQQPRQWGKPSPQTKRPPAPRFQQRFEVIPEERSSSLTSSAEDRWPEKNRRRSLPVKLTEIHSESNVGGAGLNGDKAHSRRYSLGSISSVIIAKLMGRPLQAIPCIQRGPNNENQQIIVLSPKDELGANGNSSKGRDALLAMNRADFNRLSQGWMNFYILNPTSEPWDQDNGVDRNIRTKIKIQEKQYTLSSLRMPEDAKQGEKGKPRGSREKEYIIETVAEEDDENSNIVEQQYVLKNLSNRSGKGGGHLEDKEKSRKKDEEEEERGRNVCVCRIPSMEKDASQSTSGGSVSVEEELGCEPGSGHCDPVTQPTKCTPGSGHCDPVAQPTKCPPRSDNCDPTARNRNTPGSGNPDAAIQPTKCTPGSGHCDPSQPIKRPNGKRKSEMSDPSPQSFTVFPINQVNSNQQDSTFEEVKSSEFLFIGKPDPYELMCLNGNENQQATPKQEAIQDVETEGRLPPLVPGGTNSTLLGTAKQEKKPKSRSKDSSPLKVVSSLDENVRLHCSSTILQTTKPIHVTPRKPTVQTKRQNSLPELRTASTKTPAVQKTESCVEILPQVSVKRSDQEDSDSTVYFQPPSPRVPPLPLQGELNSERTISSSSESEEESKQSVAALPGRFLPLRKRGVSSRLKVTRDSPIHCRPGSGSWTVTVAGTVELSRAAPDLQMKLSFPVNVRPPIASQSDSGFAEDANSSQNLDTNKTKRQTCIFPPANVRQKWTVTVKNPLPGKQNGEKQKAKKSYSLLPELGPQGGPKKGHKRDTPMKDKLVIEQKLSEIWPRVQEILETELQTFELGAADGGEDVASFAVLGSRVQLETKPPVQTMSERDVTRNNTSRSCSRTSTTFPRPAGIDIDMRLSPASSMETDTLKQNSMDAHKENGHS